MNHTIAGQLKELFIDTLEGVDPDKLDDDTEMEVLQLDELEVRELASAIEAQFCIDFSPDHIEDAETFRELTRLVTTKAGN